MMVKKNKKFSSIGVYPELQNDAKTLFANIRFASLDQAIKTIALVSAMPDEGKTTTSLNLAAAIATSGNRVCVVEADMRRHTLSTVFAIHEGKGVYAFLSGQVPLMSIIHTTSIPNLFFVDAEPYIPNPADMIASKRYKAFIDELATQFDYVIFDTPPLGIFVDAAVLSSLVDGVVVVVKRGQTKRDIVQRAVEQLKKANAHILGAVMVGCEHEAADYYYYYDNTRGSRKTAKDAKKIEKRRH